MVHGPLFQHDNRVQRSDTIRHRGLSEVCLRAVMSLCTDSAIIDDTGALLSTECNMQPCEAFVATTSLSECSVPCGGGEGVRSTTCTSNYGYSAPVSSCDGAPASAECMPLSTMPTLQEYNFGRLWAQGEGLPACTPLLPCIIC